jgi:DNA-binding beta-propeller fold protein YncE
MWVCVKNTYGHIQGPNFGTMASWPLSSATVRLLWLRSCCAVAEGAEVALTAHTASSHCAPDACVGAVLADALGRVTALGGREGMARSLGSVYGGSVTRFLGGCLRGTLSRVIAAPGVESMCNGVAVSRDGSTLLLSDWGGGSHAIHEYSVADGSQLQVIGGAGDGPLRFWGPCQLWVASDDFVFVADCDNHRVQVLTPRLDFHSFVGVGQLYYPAGVCVNADVVAVSEYEGHRVSVFSRDAGALVRRFGREGGGDGELQYPRGICFLSDGRHVAVADSSNGRVSVFSVDGEFERHVGAGVLKRCRGVVCSAFDELVVADYGNHRVVLFSACGDMHMAFGSGMFTGVALHRGFVVAASVGEHCTVFDAESAIEC